MPAAHRAKLLWFLPALAVMLAIFSLSSQQRVPTAGFNTQIVAIAGHLAAYGVLAIALLIAFEQKGLPSRKAALWAFGGSAAYGLTDEIHQYFVPGRQADPIDLITNAIGAAVFLWVVMCMRANPAQSVGRRMLAQSRRRP
ncbi:hypothetical protein BH24CHL4_BH24CHL4_17820 [soil metagenome]